MPSIFEGLRPRAWRLLVLGLPSCLTYLVQFSLQFWSMLFVGHLGEGYLGAAALANMTANLTGFSVGLGLATALDTLCTQAYGAKNYMLTGLHCQRAMVILSLICFPLALIWSQTKLFLEMLGIPSEQAALSGSYTRILIIGMWPWFMFECYRRYLQAQRIMWPIALSAVIVSPCNLVLNVLLVKVADMGFHGAALSTALSNWLMMFALIFLSKYQARNRRGKGGSYRLVSSEEAEGTDATPLSDFVRVSANRESDGSWDNEEFNLQQLKRREGPDSRGDTPMTDDVFDDDGEDHDMADRSLLRPSQPAIGTAVQATSVMPMFVLPASPFADGSDPENTWPPLSKDILRGWREFFVLGLPSAFSVFVEWGSFEVTSVLAATLGKVLLDTHTVFCQSVAIWYMPALGLSTATSTLIGNALGANSPGEARAVAWTALMMVGVYGVLNAALFCFGLRGLWMYVFSSNADVQNSVYTNMPILFPYSAFDVVKCISMSIMRGAGLPKITVWANVMSCVLVGFPLAFTLTLKANGGLLGLWGAMATAWMTACIVYTAILGRMDWQRMADTARKRSGNPQIQETHM
eukprot:m.60206 g.60206  ORF g.60206 m.60206 type:complete len:579 (-) comp7013_c0_seq1:425-2161(-)